LNGIREQFAPIKLTMKPLVRFDNFAFKEKMTSYFILIAKIACGMDLPFPFHHVIFGEYDIILE
jgi:hypothetical protein